MKDTYVCGHVVERGSGIMIDVNDDRLCPECVAADVAPLKKRVENMLDTPLKALYLEVLDTADLLRSEDYAERAQRLETLVADLVDRSMIIGRKIKREIADGSHPNIVVFNGQKDVSGK